MPRPFKKKLRFLLRTFWALVLFAIIALAAVVQIGRASFPLLDDYKDSIARHFSRQIGADVRIGAIEAEWQGMRPEVTLLDVTVTDNGHDVFSVDRVDLEVALLATIRDWRLAADRLAFSGMQMGFDQSASGHWSVRGLTRDTTMIDPSGEPVIDDPLDVFLFGRRIELLDTQLSFRFRTDVESQVRLPRIHLENDRKFHRLTASFALDDANQTVRLVVEGQGDPRDRSSFDAKGYVQLTQFPAERVLAAFGLGGSAPVNGATDPDQAQAASAGSLDMRVWFEGTVQKGLRWHGQFASRGVPLRLLEDAQEPDIIVAKLVGEWHRKRGWQMSLRNLAAAWPDFITPALNVHLSGALDAPPTLAIERLPVDTWLRAVHKLGILPPAADGVLEQMKPSGVLHNMHVSLRDEARGFFELRANLDNLAVDAWQNAPAIEGVDGFVHATAEGGSVVLNRDRGFVMDFPRIYAQPLVFNSARGEVRWQVDTQRGQVGVSSGHLQLSDEFTTATGLLNLRLPWRKSSADEPEMTLVIGSEAAPAMQHRKLVPDIVPTDLHQWLDDSVRDGELHKIGFIYHGTLAKDSELAKALQFYTEVRDAELAFSPDWPAAKVDQATVYFDDQRLVASPLAGSIAGLEIVDGRVGLLPAAESQGPPSLTIQAQAEGDSRDLIQLLEQSPVREDLGERIFAWQFSGDIDGSVNLTIPLAAETSGSHRAQVSLRGNTLHLPDLDLTFNDIRGQLHYDSESGLSATGLATRFWQHPLEVDIATARETENVQVDITGMLSLPHLQQWLPGPQLEEIQGVTRVTSQLNIPLGGQRPTVFTASSDLQGVAVRLPAPMGKTPEEATPVNMEVAVYPESPGNLGREVYWVNLADRSELRFVMQDKQLMGLTWGLGEPVAKVEPGVINIQGHLSRVYLDRWRSVLTPYLNATTMAAAGGRELTGTSGPGGAPLPVRLVLTVDQLFWQHHVLQQTAVVGEYEGGSWQVGLENANISGELTYSGEDLPLDLNLDYLKLPDMQRWDPLPEEGEEESLTPLLESLRPLQVRVGQLELGGEPFGQWQFGVRPLQEGVAVYDLSGSIRGLTIAGKRQRGAELIWLRTPAGESTYFSGTASAGDIGQVMQAWGQAQALTSSSAQFDLDVHWPAAPMALELTELAGTVAMNLTRGRFIRGAQAGENPLLKLIGLLNFDTLARRLRLDFSDLNPEGMGYESVNGELLFAQGSIAVAQPLQVNTPSTQIQFVGDIDMEAQELDAQLVATLPVAGNLTVAAALTGGLPVAVGVYVVGKLFKDQVDKVSSIRYSVEGPWDKPKVDVEKVFENRTENFQGTQSSAAP